jgi:hypothetical protein
VITVAVHVETGTGEPTQLDTSHCQTTAPKSKEKLRVSALDPVPGLPGIIAIIVSVVLVSIVITVITKCLLHWVPVTAAIVVGVWAVQVINR